MQEKEIESIQMERKKQNYLSLRMTKFTIQKIPKKQTKHKVPAGAKKQIQQRCVLQNQLETSVVFLTAAVKILNVKRKKNRHLH